MKYDLIIRGGSVVDGSGKPAVRADVAVNGDRIAAIGLFADATAEREIDATGMVVSPGFVDLHTHLEITGSRKGDRCAPQIARLNILALADVCPEHRCISG